MVRSTAVAEIFVADLAARTPWSLALSAKQTGHPVDPGRGSCHCLVQVGWDGEGMCILTAGK